MIEGRWQVCGACAARLLASGASGARVDTETTIIDLGRACSLHRSGLAPQATVAVVIPSPGIEWPDDVPTNPYPLDTLESAPPPPWTSLPPRRDVGPVTSVATALLASWTHEAGATCDDLTINRAVAAAQKLMLITKGS